VEVLRTEAAVFPFEAVPAPSVPRASSARSAIVALKRNERLLSLGRPE
jgi:hypothetical protein